MKRILFIHTLAGALLLSLSACEQFFNQIVEIDPPAYEPSLVFHQIVETGDSSIQLLLTRNYGILETVEDPEKWYVSGAQVEWWQDGQKIRTLSPLSPDSSFVYTGTFPSPIQSGKNYEIRVSHPDFPSVTATQTAPPPLPSLLNKKITVGPPGNFPGEVTQQVEVSFQDPADSENYYELSIGAKYKYLNFIGFDPQGNPTYDTLESISENIYLKRSFDPLLVNGWGDALLVSDRSFNGQAYIFKAEFLSYQYPNEFPPQYFIQIRNCSKEYYQWSRSYYQQYNTSGNPFVEPVSVFNNLENGLGIFGMYSTIRVDL